MGEPIRFDEELHTAGERCAVSEVRLTQALAWSLASELVRRHPADLRVIETHPGGGQYDCVSVYRVGAREEPEIVVHFNLTGSVTHGSWFGDGDSERFNWLEVLLCSDRRSYVVEQLERSERLGSPSQSPSTQSPSIGPMVIAAFLERSVLGPAAWGAVNGVADSSDGVDVRSHLFDQFPGAASHADAVDDGIGGRHESRFWFVGPTSGRGVFDLREGAFAVDTWSGDLWTRGSVEGLNLLSSYEACGRSLDALVSTVCPPAF